MVYDVNILPYHNILLLWKYFKSFFKFSSSAEHSVRKVAILTPEVTQFIRLIKKVLLLIKKVVLL